MKLKTLAALALPVLALAAAPLASTAAPRSGGDKLLDMSLESAFHHPLVEDKIPKDIKFYFGDQPVTVKQILGPVKSSRKTSNGKGVVVSCPWALTSALIALAEEARLQGGNAVVGIKSNFGDIESTSNSTYKCGKGSMMVGVALKGDIAVVE
jgi:hypothetical protein